MSQSKFEINVPSSQLPPATVKVFAYSGSDLEKDIYQTYRAVAISLKIINSHASNAITVSIDGQPSFTIPASSLINLDDIQYTTLSLSGTGTGEVILKVIPQNRLVSSQLLEVD